MAENREPRRRQVDPLLGVAAEAARAGLRGADYVVEGMSEGLRRSTGRRSAGAAAGRKRAAPKAHRAQSKPPGPEGPPPPPVTGSTADLLVGLLERFGEAVQDTAAAISEREWFEGEPEGPTLELRGPPGHQAAVEFAFTNTGPSALTKVTFEATDLLGATERIDAGAVSFQFDDEAYIPRVGPGGTARVIVEVAIPEVPAGDYRGVIAARSGAPEGRAEAEGGPEDAWALIELEVAAIDPRSAITPVERAREA